MEKERIALLAQLLTALRDGAERLEKAYVDEDMESLKRAKQEILALQMKIERLI